MTHGRLVVTGYDAEGRSVFVRDEAVEAMQRPGIGYTFRFWSADEIAVHPHSGQNPEAPNYFPPVNGVRFFTTTLTPQGGRPAVVQDGPEDHMSTLYADMSQVMEHDAPGMHTTDSTDFVVITGGQVALELDDGAEAVLSAGDVVIQNGTRHRWRAVGDEPVSLTCVLVGARRDPRR